MPRRYSHISEYEKEIIEMSYPNTSSNTTITVFNLKQN